VSNIVGTSNSSIDRRTRVGSYLLGERVGNDGDTSLYVAIREVSGNRERVLLRMRGQGSFSDIAEQDRYAKLVERYLSLSHVALVQGFDGFWDGDAHVTAFELVRGTSLQEVLKRVRQQGFQVPRVTALHIGKRVFGALASAHGLRDPRSQELVPVVHGAVDPANILVPVDGYLRLSEFRNLELARAWRRKSIEPAVHYAAPEVQRGGYATIRADVYSAAVLLWELLTGQLFPLSSEELNAASRRGTGVPNEVRFSTVCADLPVPVTAVLDSALEPREELRVKTAAQVVAALRTHVDGDAAEVWLRDIVGQLFSGATERHEAMPESIAELDAVLASASDRPSAPEALANAIAHRPILTPPAPPLDSDASGLLVRSDPPANILGLGFGSRPTLPDLPAQGGVATPSAGRPSPEVRALINLPGAGARATMGNLFAAKPLTPEEAARGSSPPIVLTGLPSATEVAPSKPQTKGTESKPSASESDVAFLPKPRVAAALASTPKDRPAIARKNATSAGGVSSLGSGLEEARENLKKGPHVGVAKPAADVAIETEPPSSKRLPPPSSKRLPPPSSKRHLPENAKGESAGERTPAVATAPVLGARGSVPRPVPSSAASSTVSPAVAPAAAPSGSTNDVIRRNTVQIALVQKRTVTQALPAVRPSLAREPTDEEDTHKRADEGLAPTAPAPTGAAMLPAMGEPALTAQPSLAPSLAVSFPPMEVEPADAAAPIAALLSGEVDAVDLPPKAPALASSQWTPAGPPFAPGGAPEHGMIVSGVEDVARSPLDASVDPALFLAAAVPPSPPRIELSAQPAVSAPLPTASHPEFVSIGLPQTALGTPAFPMLPNAPPNVSPKAPRKRGLLLPLLFAGGSGLVLASGLLVWLARMPDAPHASESTVLSIRTAQRVASAAASSGQVEPSREATTQGSGEHAGSSTSDARADITLPVTGQPTPPITVTASTAFAQATVTTATAAAIPATGPTATGPTATGTTTAPASNDSSPVPQGSTRLVTEGAAPGRRIFVDGRVVGQTPASVLVACGSRSVKVGSSGTERRVDLPCGQSFSAK
jgi:hypothetical protein